MNKINEKRIEVVLILVNIIDLFYEYLVVGQLFYYDLKFVLLSLIKFNF